MSLKNKVAIVTGAGVGIGRGIALALAKENCKIIATDLNQDNIDRVVEEIKEMGGEAYTVRADVSKKEEVEELFEKTMNHFGKLDILVNNAGIYPFVSFSDMKEEDWDKVMDVNVRGVFYTCKEANKHMSDGGRIVNISSIASIVGFEGLVHYCASKGAVNSFTRALALELAPRKILVNAVAPGAIETPGASQGMNEERKKQTEAIIPLARYGQPEDIANTVTFLVSDKATYITGQTIVVDGGWTLR